MTCIHASFNPIISPSTPSTSTPTTSNASTVYSDDRTRTISQVKHELVRSFDDKQSTIHHLIHTHFPSLTTHSLSSLSILSQLQQTQDQLSAIEGGLRSTENLTHPLLTHLHSQTLHSQTLSLSLAHIATLEELHARTRALGRLEQKVRGGVVDLGEEEFIGLGGVVGLGGERGEVGEILRRSKAWACLQDRAKHLENIHTDQLREAFGRAFDPSPTSSNEAGVGGSELVGLVFREQVRLRGWSESGKKPSTLPPPVSFHHLLLRLDRYDLLIPLLPALHDRLVQGLLTRLTRTDSEREARLGRREGEGEVRWAITWEREGGGKVLDEERDKRLFSSLLGFFDRLALIFQVPPRDPVASGLNGTLEKFVNGIKTSLIQSIIKEKIQRTVPTSRFQLPPWSQSITRAMEFEHQLIPASSLISSFYLTQAGGFWAGQVRSGWLERAEGIIRGGWEGWDSVEVKKERRVGLGGSVTEGQGQDQDQGQTENENENEVGLEREGEKDGWGFGEWNEDTSSAMEKEDKRPSSEEDSGWGFDDDDDLAPAPKPTAPPISKPIRQARKLGKKNKQPTLLERDERDEREGEGASSDVNSVILGSDVGEEWNDPWERGDGSRPEQLMEKETGREEIVVERYYVSKACDSLLEILLDVLEMSQGLETISIPSPSFTDLSRTIQSAGPDILDLYRTLMPKAHAAQIDHVPALAMQFSNDCLQIADVVESMAAGSTWDPTESTLELRRLSEKAYERQMDIQRRGVLEDVSEANGFENSSSSRAFEHQKQVMSQIRHKLEMLHRVWATVLTEPKCLISIGQLVETAVVQVTNDIVAIPDITADESERLKQICDVLRPVEEMFNSHGVNIVAYVPHWLRFCYVAEIMEASLADITYLFESGALIDFTPDELVHLILALFSDTPIRRDTIAKIIASRHMAA